MNLYRFKCPKFTNNKKNIKREINGKLNLYYYCIECAFRKFETTDKEK